MKNKALFIGFKNCDDSNKAFEFLQLCGFETTPVWTEKKRGAKLPIFVKNWSGEYLFHLKSYCILKKRLLDRVSIAAVNFHPCPPKYPGAGGINWALYNEDSHTGVTVHFMNEKVDNGKIIKTYKIPIYEKDGVKSLIDRIQNKQMQAFYDIVGQISIHGSSILQKLSQENSHEKWGTHTGKMKEIDQLETINTDISKEQLTRIIRATKIGPFGPKIKIHGYTFRYEEKK